MPYQVKLVNSGLSYLSLTTLPPPSVLNLTLSFENKNDLIISQSCLININEQITPALCVLFDNGINLIVYNV